MRPAVYRRMECLDCGHQWVPLNLHHMPIQCPDWECKSFDVEPIDFEPDMVHCALDGWHEPGECTVKMMSYTVYTI